MKEKLPGETTANHQWWEEWAEAGSLYKEKERLKAIRHEIYEELRRIYGEVYEEWLKIYDHGLRAGRERGFQESDLKKFAAWHIFLGSTLFLEPGLRMDTDDRFIVTFWEGELDKLKGMHSVTSANSV